MKSSSVGTYLMLFLGMAFFGSATPVSKIVGDYFPIFITGGLRVLMAALVLAPFVEFGKLGELKKWDIFMLIGISLVGVLGFTAFLLYGMKQVSGVAGSIVMSGAPAVTAGLSFLFFGDRFGWRKGLALFLAVGGVWVMNFFSADKGGDTTWIGVLLVAAAVFCEAGYTLFGKAATKDFDPVFVAGISATLGFLLFIPPGLIQISQADFASVPAEGWLALAWYGIGTMGVGSVLWYNGVQKVEGSVAAAFMGVMPISALVLSYVLLGEPFEWIHLAGFGLVFAGVLLVMWAHARMSRGV